MARVILQSPLKWDGTLYPAGFAVDLPDDLLDGLPAGVFRPLDVPVQLFVPSAGAPEGRQPFMPRIRPIQSSAT